MKLKTLISLLTDIDKSVKDYDGVETINTNVIFEDNVLKVEYTSNMTHTFNDLLRLCSEIGPNLVTTPVRVIVPNKFIVGYL